MNDLSATDRCVKCGLCLPHCPTFTLTGNEADSPRGRLSLMQVLDQNHTEWSPGLFQHLDRCLQCQACEAMCPSKVPFGQLMDSARARLEPRRSRNAKLLRRAALRLVASPHWSRGFAALVAGYRYSGMHWLVGRLPVLPARLQRADRLLPAAPPAAAKPATGHTTAVRGSVQLFKGCMSSALDPQTLKAAERLLERLGYRVDSVEGQRCCGALHQHNGDPAGAARLASANVSAFADDRSPPVLATASACSAQLRQYGALYPHAESFSARVGDILHFLAAQDPGALAFQAPGEPVAVHVPCSHRNALRQEQDIFDVLKWIPDIELLPLARGAGCCGAAGSYMLDQPELSDQLQEQAVERIAASGARLLVTSNIGCALQLQAGLKRRGLAVEVMHPVVLLERCLASAPD